MKIISEHKMLEVSAIRDGTVIDHIPPGSLFTIIKVLDLDIGENRVTFATNLPSKRMGKKAIIKISDKYCADEEINQLALVAPNAKINIIRDYEVVEKRLVEVPESISGFVRCANPVCITNTDKVTTKFTISSKNEELQFRCHYCEKSTPQSQIEIIIATHN